MRVAVALSGGVDSAVAAALLRAQGYEVIGVHLLFSRSGDGGAGLNLVREVGSRLGIEVQVLDFSREFEQLVIEPFCREYGAGRTPNPCIVCNRRLKFELLHKELARSGVELIATGHYARIVRDEAGSFHLLRGVDPRKDQSYFLYTLDQEQLGRVLFPVGGITKEEVREQAQRFGLPNAERLESQEICFIPDGDYTGFIRRRHPEFFQPGPVYDTSGRLLGSHEGIAGFTIGQRRGIKLALGERRYVVRIDAPSRAVYLGGEEEVYQTQVWAGDVHWVSGRPPAEKVRVWAKVRYQGPGGFAEVEPLPDNRVYVKFEQPQWAPTPGQAVVFWQGDEVLGGGTIEQSSP